MTKAQLNFIFATIPRVLSALILMFYALFRISIPIIKGQAVYLDKNDGYIILGSICLLVAIEAVKAFISKYLHKKAQ